MQIRRDTWRYSVLFPIAVFLGYMLIIIACNLFSESLVVGAFTGDSVTAALLLLLYFMGHWAVEREDDEPYKFSFFGWCCLLVAFFAMYVIAETAGNVLNALVDVSSNLYSEMTDEEFKMYVIMALSIGPLCEELMFRACMFRCFRYKLNFWVSYLLSAGIFTAIHGTTAHIPVTMMLSFFLSLLYEETGKFRYCLIFHLFFNLLSATYLIVLPFTVPFTFVIYGALSVLFVFGGLFRKKLFGTYFRLGAMPSLESRLEKKLKDLTERDIQE